VPPWPYRFETSALLATFTPSAAHPVEVPEPVTGPQPVECVVPLPGLTPGDESVIEAFDGFELVDDGFELVDDAFASFFAWPGFCAGCEVWVCVVWVDCDVVLLDVVADCVDDCCAA
jgi:hypothetical protein